MLIAGSAAMAQPQESGSLPDNAQEIWADRLSDQQKQDKDSRKKATPAYKEPGVPSGGPAPLWGMLVSLILVFMVLGVSLMPSKRGHQD